MSAKNKKILILAANGMAGHVISKTLEKNNHINSEFDSTTFSQLNQMAQLKIH